MTAAHYSSSFSWAHQYSDCITKILKTGSGEIVQGLKHIPQPCGHLNITRCSSGGLKYQRVQLIPYFSTQLLIELAELSQYVGPQVLEVAVGDSKLPLLNKKMLKQWKTVFTALPARQWRWESAFLPFSSRRQFWGSRWHAFWPLHRNNPLSPWYIKGHCHFWSPLSGTPSPISLHLTQQKLPEVIFQFSFSLARLWYPTENPTISLQTGKGNQWKFLYCCHPIASHLQTVASRSMI